ncbi:MAG: hypothetical protein J7L83_02110 [Thaumarchaeota archaeon]|nr:hypothetical protein [Nitrososphaerota archaeon]
MPYRVKLEFSGGVRVVCVLEEVDELKNLAEKSPFTSEANRWGDEVYFELPAKLNLKGEKTLMKVGEVAYWPEGNSLCLFFGPTPVSRGSEPRAYSEVKSLGEVVEGLGGLKKVKSGEEVKVEVEKI